MSDLKIQLVKSLNGRLPKHVRIAEALGLRKVRQTVVRPDTAVIRGMVEKIGYLVEIKK
ncbi:MAG TPA: 50S ribosomal protein L30 [bacterium]|jgi:large subunit ribosomal protein L30|nr:50S ribosomal protein L30 [bacterium]